MKTACTPAPPLPISPSPPLCLRLGLRYVKGMSEASGRAIVRERERQPFAGIDDLRFRVPELQKDELRKLAAVGALNFIQRGDESGKSKKVHRRDALWQAERVSRPAGALYERLSQADGNSPLLPMSLPERLNADLRGTGITIGRHPVAMYRQHLKKLGVSRSVDIKQLRNGSPVRVAGWVLVRQRPGTAKGFVFLTLEDETGVANIIITPQVFDRNRLVVVDNPFLMIEGKLQNQDNVISVKARNIQALKFDLNVSISHDFH